MATVKLVAIKSLKSASHNPVSRVLKVNRLAKSIADVGLLDPIKISAQNVIIDGHRRVAAYRKLGIEEIDAIVLSGDPAVMYAHLNAESKKLSGNEHLAVYLTEPTAISNLYRNRLEHAESVVGRVALKRMAREGLSVSTFNLAKRIARAAERDTNAAVVKALKWLMHFGCYSVAQKALDMGTPSAVIWDAINQMKPIRVKFDVAK